MYQCDKKLLFKLFEMRRKAENAHWVQTFRHKTRPQLVS